MAGAFCRQVKSAGYAGGVDDAIRRKSVETERVEVSPGRLLSTGDARFLAKRLHEALVRSTGSSLCRGDGIVLQNPSGALRCAPIRLPVCGVTARISPQLASPTETESV